VAKKTSKAVEVAAETAQPEAATTHEMITYEALVRDRVHVRDESGNEFYLDPARKQGEFVLRVIPNPVEESAEPIPAEWVKPTAEEVAAANSGVIDWGMNEEPSEEGGENV